MTDFDLIVHYFCGWFFWSRQNERLLWENDTYGNNGWKV